MRILITAAEEEEIITAKQAYNSLVQDLKNRINVTFMLTGIGTTSTTYRLTKELCNSNLKYDLVVNIGIAGSFSLDHPIGSIARIEREFFGDLGFETFSGFQTLFDYKILDENTHPFKNGALIAPILETKIEDSIKDIPKATSVTVQTVSGLPEKREQLIKGFTPQIESMEGAAFFYICILENIPFIELRSVSNEVGERDRSKWNIPLALDSLKEGVKKLLTGASK